MARLTSVGLSMYLVIYCLSVIGTLHTNVAIRDQSQNKLMGVTDANIYNNSRVHTFCHICIIRKFL